MPDDGVPGTAQDRANERWRRSHSEHEKDGSCNTRSADSYCPPEAKIGVDTISWGWSDGEAVERLLRLDGTVLRGEDPRPLRVVPAAGGSVRLNRRIPGLGTVGAYPGADLFYVEGRARALHERDESNHNLGRPRDLPATEQQIRDSLGDLLGRVPRAAAGLRRIDLTGELSFDRGEHGQELLELLDGLHVARLRTSPVREVGGPGVETAYWRSAVRNVPKFRAYDKGVESGTAPRGERIRLERQIRHVKGTRPTLTQWLGGDLGDLYARPLRAWLENGVAAGTAEQLMRVLTDAGEIWPSYWASGSSWASRTGTVHVSLWPARKVERVLGTLAVVHSWGSAWPCWSPKQRQRRMAEVRELGLLLTDHPVTVDVDQAVNTLCDMWRVAA